jgi:hypothetical protein
MERASRAAQLYTGISDKQQSKIEQAWRRDPDRAAVSETFRAMHHDVLMFGEAAFQNHPKRKE